MDSGCEPRAGRRFSPARRVVLLAVLISGCLSYGVYAAVTRLAGRGPVDGSLSISGRLTVPLAPGVSQPIDARIINRHRFGVAVTNLKISVAVDRRHRNAGCSPRRDFAVRQLRRAAYPIAVPRRTAATLHALGVRRLPRLVMVNRPVDQGACRGASLTLRYVARADGRRR